MLTSVTIPDSVTSIGDSVFWGCKNLKEVHISDIESWCNIVFNDSDLSNPLFFADNLYVDDELVTNIVIPYGVKQIPVYAFSCNNIKSIIISDSVTSIGDSAFSGCSSLENITIPDSVTSIGDYAFSGCSSLESITIPDSVISIGDRVFCECESIRSITIPDSVTSIEHEAFIGCSSLESIIIPDSVTSIGYWAFNGCLSLTSITIPNSVTSIGDRAFAYCSSLESVTIYNPDCEINDGSSTLSDCGVICGYKDSTAQAYAEKYDKKFAVIGSGDINCDGETTVADIVLIQQSLAGKEIDETLAASVLDMNNDGKFNVFDLIIVKRMLLSK